MFNEWLSYIMIPINLVAIISGITGLITSIYAVVLSKRRLVATAITTNRMEWISTVRAMMYDFIRAYLSDATTKEKQLIRYQIELYITEAKWHRELSRALEVCATKPYNEEDHETLIRTCQKTLNDAWLRMKREAGISKRNNDKIEEEINEKR